jgi:hypothetical protein
MKEFMEDGAQVPSALTEYDDDAGVVEFDHYLSFLRHSSCGQYMKPQDVTDARGFAIEDIDQLVFKCLGANVTKSLQWTLRVGKYVWKRR